MDVYMGPVDAIMLAVAVVVVALVFVLAILDQDGYL